LAQCQRKIARRIRDDQQPSDYPVLTARNVHYEFSPRTQGLAWGGIGGIHLLARRSGLMTALAWSLKAWLALSLTVRPGRWRERHEKQKQQLLRMEFKGFIRALIRLPCQIIQTGRKII